LNRKIIREVFRLNKEDARSKSIMYAGLINMIEKATPEEKHLTDLAWEEIRTTLKPDLPKSRNIGTLFRELDEANLIPPELYSEIVKLTPPATHEGRSQNRNLVPKTPEDIEETKFSFFREVQKGPPQIHKTRRSPE
jgi:hypothetical protein